VSEEFIKTPLFDFHKKLKAQMVTFCGYRMPVSYFAGAIKEHLHTREASGLFDVSHMGQAYLIGDKADQLLEKLVPADLQSLKYGSIRYTQLLNEDGGIVDDLLISRFPETSCKKLFLVVNASNKDKDFRFIESFLGNNAELQPIIDNGLIAIQGPHSPQVLSKIFPSLDNMPFMTSRTIMLEGEKVLVSRSGYTGEDGFEISASSPVVNTIAELVVSDERVLPVGLAARDSLRLEAGFCLYGNDIDETISPIEAGLGWSIAKRRIREENFLGSHRIISQIKEGPQKKRVGIMLLGRGLARKGTPITSTQGENVGIISSGGFGPSVNSPIAIGYVDSKFSSLGQKLNLVVREKLIESEIVTLPFIKHRYYRGIK